MKDFFREYWFAPMFWSMHAYFDIAESDWSIRLPDPVAALLGILLIPLALAWIPIGLALNVIVFMGIILYGIPYTAWWGLKKLFA